MKFRHSILIGDQWHQRVDQRPFSCVVVACECKQGMVLTKVFWRPTAESAFDTATAVRLRPWIGPIRIAPVTPRVIEVDEEFTAEQWKQRLFPMLPRRIREHPFWLEYVHLREATHGLEFWRQFHAPHALAKDFRKRGLAEWRAGYGKPSH